MKKIFLAIVSLMVLSCDKDEETLVTTPQNYLTGTWEIAQVGEVVPFNGSTVVRYSNYENDSECRNDNYVFKADMSYEVNDYSYNGTTCDDNMMSGTYTREGRTVQLPFIDALDVDKSRSLNITVLTFETMELNYLDRESGELVFLKLNKVEKK